MDDYNFKFRYIMIFIYRKIFYLVDEYMKNMNNNNILYKLMKLCI